MKIKESQPTIRFGSVIQANEKTDFYQGTKWVVLHVDAQLKLFGAAHLGFDDQGSEYIDIMTTETWDTSVVARIIDQWPIERVLSATEKGAQRLDWEKHLIERTKNIILSDALKSGTLLLPKRKKNHSRKTFSV